MLVPLDLLLLCVASFIVWFYCLFCMVGVLFFCLVCLVYVLCVLFVWSGCLSGLPSFLTISYIASVLCTCTCISMLCTHMKSMCLLSRKNVSGSILVPGDDHQALIWDIQPMPKPIEVPILAYAAEGEINQVLKYTCDVPNYACSALYMQIWTPQKCIFWCTMFVTSLMRTCTKNLHTRNTQ